MLTWKRADNVLWRAIPGYLVVATVDGTPSEVFGPGSEIWTLLAEPISVDDLVAAMAIQYSTSPDVVRADVEQLLAQLQAGGYVEQAG